MLFDDFTNAPVTRFSAWNGAPRNTFSVRVNTRNDGFISISTTGRQYQAQGVSLGEENAPVQMIVFSDFQCPGCQAWSSRIEANLKRDFVDTGKLRYTYYDFPLTSIHPHAFLAARAARCANDQGRFWDFHDRLFAAQGTWSFSGSAPVSEFTEYASMSGMNATTFTECLRSDRHADVVTANLLLGEQLGVGGTPTVFVGQRRLGDREWQDYSAVSAAIEAAGGV